MTAKSLDIAIIGGGIAGASVGCFVTELGAEAGLFEMESALAYHTTGRSAALFTPYYGPVSMRTFAALSREFLFQPPYETDAPLVYPRPAVSLVRACGLMTAERPPGSLWWDESRLLDEIPFLQVGKFIGAVVDKQVASIDVNALHAAYLQQFTCNGGQIFREARISKLSSRPSGEWILTAGNQIYRSPIVVNAAGAWGDPVAHLAGVPPVGLTPKRRTCIIIENDQFDGVDLDTLACAAVDPDRVYFQNFGKGQLMVSPMDETPSNPCDAQPSELDVAVTVERLQNITTCNIQRVSHSWAGLRTFSLDADPVIGWEPEYSGFFWLAGQGGYGIFTSPAIGRYAACLITDSSLPDEFIECGYDFSQLAPSRFRLRTDQY